MRKSFVLWWAVSLCLACGCVANPKLESSEYPFTGMYQCGEYTAKSALESVTMPTFTQEIVQTSVNGVDMITIKRSDAKMIEEKYSESPLGVKMYNPNGEWLYVTRKAQGKMIPLKLISKYDSPDKSSFSWQSESPAHTDNSGRAWPASTYSGRMWIDPDTGDKMSTASFLDDIAVCKRVR